MCHDLTQVIFNFASETVINNTNMKEIFTVKGIRSFNENRVIEKAKALLFGRNGKEELKQYYYKVEEARDEIESVTYAIECASVLGVTIKYVEDNSIRVELPWLANRFDVKLCYAILEAIKKVHRSSHILANDAEADLSDEVVMDQIRKREQRMADLLENDDMVALTGLHHNFYVSRKFYEKKGVKPLAGALADFILTQWTLEKFDPVALEYRHLDDDNDVSSVAVIDNTRKLFLFDCDYFGLYRNDNCCCIMTREQFESLAEEVEGFVQVDAHQFAVDVLSEEDWQKVLAKAQGRWINDYRRTCLFRWNSDISSNKMEDFENDMKSFADTGCNYNWAIWDHKKARIGDRFFMTRVGKDGKEGIVMCGTLSSEPWAGDDWSHKNRLVHYCYLDVQTMVHPVKAPCMLEIETLNRMDPSMDWGKGHSGVLLNLEQSHLIAKLWDEYMWEVSHSDIEKSESWIVERSIDSKPVDF